MGLSELAAGVGLGDALRLLPPVDRVTLTQWYRASDAVLVPSHSESFGLVAVEAQATGALVAASEVGGLPVAIGDAGLLLPVGDVAAWADALEPLLVEPGALAICHGPTWRHGRRPQRTRASRQGAQAFP